MIQINWVFLLGLRPLLRLIESHSAPIVSLCLPSSISLTRP